MKNPTTEENRKFKNKVQDMKTKYLKLDCSSYLIYKNKFVTA